MPSFCRHNRLVQNCPICSREQHVEMRPVVSPGGQTVRTPAPPGERAPRQPGARRSGSSGSRSGGAGVRVRRLARGADDGYRCGLAPGLRSSQDAARLAEELAFAAARLDALSTAPPGLYAELADTGGELEERTWLAFQIALIGPSEDEDPFAAIAAARTSWASGEPPALDGVSAGARGAIESAAGGARTAAAYRAWAGRSGSQEAAVGGEGSWTPERRFSRILERLALPGFPRGARFELLTILGQTGLYELHPSALAFGGSDDVTVAAKRLLGIGDPLLLERRAADLATACGLPLGALDLAFFNWERGERARLGIDPELEPDADLLASVEDALGL